jgi:predicted nucleic acid-binding Zn ribbon protein
MNKCRNCGVFVPIEKAFCPNCSEPVEPEEAPNRATTSSSDMMATMRDDPENYRELLALKKQLKTGQQETPASDSVPAHLEASVSGYSLQQMAPDIAPAAKNNKRNLAIIIGTVSILIVLFVILLVFKVI